MSSRCEEDHSFLKFMNWNHLLDYVNDEIYSEICLQKKAENIQIGNFKREDEAIYFTLDRMINVKELTSTWLRFRHNECGKRRNMSKKKSMDLSEHYKSEGNKHYKFANYDLAVTSYTKSAQYAPADSDIFSIAIGNRSAALFRMSRYKECIEDITVAIKFGCPENLKYKLLVRKAECHVKLGDKVLAKQTILEARNVKLEKHPCKSIDELVKKLNSLTIEVSKLKSRPKENVQEIERLQVMNFPQPQIDENPNFRCASKAIRMRYTPEKGRHVVANRNIKRGEILFVEKAFTFALLMNNSNICHNCCRSYDNPPIPCKNCVTVSFCNLSCWEEAQSYHRWECAGFQMDLWSQIGIAYLALKMLFTCVNTTDKQRFNDVQKLLTNCNQYSGQDIIQYSTTAIMLTMYLVKDTDFFDVVNVRNCFLSKFSCDSSYDLDTNGHLYNLNPEQLYVSSFLLRYILQLIGNGHAITAISMLKTVDMPIDPDRSKIENKYKMYDVQQDRIATAIYPSASMMNHSCDPNIINSFIGDLLIVKATRSIKTDEEVLHCYGPHFRRMLTNEREFLLSQQYFFTCTCEPCIDTNTKDFLLKFTSYKCNRCENGPFEKVSFNVPTWSVGGQKNTLLCINCGNVIYEDSEEQLYYSKQLENATKYFEKAMNYINTQQYNKAITKLKICLIIRRKLLYKSHLHITMTLDRIAQVYALSKDWLNCIAYLEQSLVGIEERFGYYSVEVCHELNKITDVCVTYLQNELNTSEDYKKIWIKTRRYLVRTLKIVDDCYGPWNDLYSETVTKMNLSCMSIWEEESST